MQLTARLLVVDDNPDNREMLSRRLRRLGYANVECAVDGEEALAMNNQAPFDVILLDVMMPRKSGIEVLQQLRNENRLEQTPVIMISAATEVDTVVRCLELGAEDYLPKPFNPVLLRARLGSVLEKKALRAEVRRQLGRMEAEMAEARRQQLSMVPTEFPSAAGGMAIDVHAIMHPAREVGGDLYDCFALDERTLCVAVGDVSDKGMPAALFMARARSLLRAATLAVYRYDGTPAAPGRNCRGDEHRAVQEQSALHVRDAVFRISRSRDRHAALRQCGPRAAVPAACGPACGGTGLHQRSATRRDRDCAVP